MHSWPESCDVCTCSLLSNFPSSLPPLEWITNVYRHFQIMQISYSSKFPLRLSLAPMDVSYLNWSFAVMATDFSIPELPLPLQVALGHYKQKLFLLSYLRIRLIFTVDLRVTFWMVLTHYLGTQRSFGHRALLLGSSSILVKYSVIFLNTLLAGYPCSSSAHTAPAWESAMVSFSDWKPRFGFPMIHVMKSNYFLFH